MQHSSKRYFKQLPQVKRHRIILTGYFMTGHLHSYQSQIHKLLHPSSLETSLKPRTTTVLPIRVLPLKQRRNRR
jgi:hypothetical protein